MQKSVIILLVFFLSGCAGKVEYFNPKGTPPTDNSITLHQSKDEIWKKIIPALGKEFFVINNLDKDSGLINLSYSGDPEKYIDCGRIVSYVSNARGERTYDFPASKANQEYETLENGAYFHVKRKMSLDGRINLIIEEKQGDQCIASVNTKYIVTKTIMLLNATGRYQTISDTVSFNSGQWATFDGGTTCQPNGKLEGTLLSLLNK